MRTPLRGLHVVAFGIILTGISALESSAQSQRPYKDGPVQNVSSIRTMPGQMDNYMRYLFTDYAKMMNAQKEAGIITGWSVATVQPRTPDDADVILSVTYANMAALDNLRDRVEPVGLRVLGMTPDQTAQGNAQRGQMRRQIGIEMHRLVVASQ